MMNLSKKNKILLIVLIVLSWCIIYATLDLIGGCDEIYDIAACENRHQCFNRVGAVEGKESIQEGIQQL